MLLSSTMWIVVPAPALALLALAVLVPELAPWFAVVCLVALVVCFRFTRGRTRVVAVGMLAIATGCTFVPIVAYPFAHEAARLELDGNLGAPQNAGEGDVPIRVVRDVPVRTRDGAHLGLDVYTPLAAGARPAIVTIYGGAWIFGDRTQLASIDRAYAAQGYTVIAIDYRHAPAYHYPTQVHDVEDALATIAAHAHALHVDPRRVVLFGRSAGAELALLAGYERQPLTVRALIGYYAPTDLTAGYATPPAPDPANVRAILRAYLGTTPERASRAYRRASPLNAVRAGLPPTLLIAGDRDELVDIAFQRRLRDALRAHGDRVVAIEIPWSNHAFDEVPNGLGGRIATAATIRFLDAVVPASTNRSRE